MYRLVALGGLTLTNAAGGVAARQRRRLALLALLAPRGEHGMTRDKLLGYLWPEQTAERARHALEQLIYYLRREVSGELFAGGDPLRLNPAVVTSDVGEFEAALGRGALDEAVALYRGPFLDGFYLSEAAGFEEWVETERQRLATEHARALYRLARDAAGQERHTEAVDWWRRLAAADPLSERNALGLAQALARAGNRPAALRMAQEYELLLRQELAVAPSPELRAFLERLRSEPEAQPGPARTRDAPADLRSAAIAVPADASPRQRYRIERPLGRGKTASVYLARDLKHNRLVALKVLRPELAASTEARRFVREIAIVAALQHPHILQLYDSGVLEPPGEPSGPFYVMPYVRGESVRQQLVREVQLPVEVAVRLAREVAEGLEYAHASGIVHRDIKPENVLLEAGHALISNFGIAHALDVAAGEKLSVSGMSLGTPAYMSPEQAIGAPGIDGRSDIYSLACVLYEMLSGEPPFTGRTSAAILARHAADPVPPLRTLCPAIPRGVEAAVTRALAKLPDQRFRTAGEFAAALGSQ